MNQFANEAADKDKIVINAYGRKDIQIIRTLWERLNEHHEKRSTSFKPHFRNFSFSQRIEALLTREKLVIFVARSAGTRVGYCVATLDRQKAEIDSIFVIPESRGMGIGEMLLKRAIQWLEDLNGDQIRVAIAEGNEPAMAFYGKFGFAIRFTVMQRMPEHQDAYRR